jgi:uncharacterized protein (DUF2141 family)
MLIRAALPLLLLVAPATTAPRTPAESPRAGTITLTVIVSGAEQSGGVLRAALFAAPAGFPTDVAKAAQVLARPRVAAVDSFVFRGVEAGKYAVSVYHDTSSNDRLDSNMFGAPREPWGTTGGERPKLRAPRFDEATITLTADTRLDIKVER